MAARVVLRRASEEVIEASAKVCEAVDERGRHFGLRKPGVLLQYRLVDMLGAETSRNEVYMGMVLPLLWVETIDGERIAPPRTKLELEALIERVDEEGLVAIAATLGGLAEETAGDEEKLKNG